MSYWVKKKYPKTLVTLTKGNWTIRGKAIIEDGCIKDFYLLMGDMCLKH